MNTGRFWAKVDTSGGLFACWPWMGARNPKGYGKVGAGRTERGTKRTIDAHRVALEQKLGRPIRPGFFACHTCDNKPCVNPAHLYEGSRADNTRDAVTRRRFRPGRLRQAELEEIRSRLAAGESQRAVGARYGLSQSAISLYVLGKIAVAA